MNRRSATHSSTASVGAHVAILLVGAAFLPAACNPDAEDEIGTAAGALQTVSSQPGSAKGPVVAARVTGVGDIVCTKSDGGRWTSSAGGHVEFFLRRPGEANFSFVDSREYAPQPPDGYLYEITLPATALNLTAGTGYSAKCVAIPYIDIPQGTLGWAPCLNSKTGEPTMCTESAPYDFDVVAGSADPEGIAQTNCGQGEGKSQGFVGCIKEKEVLPGAYRYDFDCKLNENYEVWLRTTGPEKQSTILKVYDVEGAYYGFSAEEKKQVDTVSFKAASNHDKCYAVVEAKKKSSILLKVRTGKQIKLAGMPLRGHRFTLFIDAGHGKPATADNYCQGDDERATNERAYNERMKAGALATVTPNEFYEVIDYDTTVLPWAANYYGEAKVDIRARETQVGFGCDGYRGYMMRLWTRENHRDSTRSMALQIHNNKSGPGSVAIAGGDTKWLESMKKAMEDIGQVDEARWTDELGGLDHGRGGFVRGALGYTTCKPGVPQVPQTKDYYAEFECDKTVQNLNYYGRPLQGAVLLEVATLDQDWVFHNWYLKFIENGGMFDPDPMDPYPTAEDKFVAMVGPAIASRFGWFYLEKKQ